MGSALDGESCFTCYQHTDEQSMLNVMASPNKLMSRHLARCFAGTADRQLFRPEPGIRGDRGNRWRAAHRKPRSAGTPDSRKRTGARARRDGAMGLFPAGISVARLVSPILALVGLVGTLAGGLYRWGGISESNK
jgi:hypothetical protein